MSKAAVVYGSTSSKLNVLQVWSKCERKGLREKGRESDLIFSAGSNYMSSIKTRQSDLEVV